MKSKKISLIMAASVIGTSLLSTTPAFASEITNNKTNIINKTHINEYSQFINIPDENLKAYINNALNHEPTASITQKDADSITELDIDGNEYMIVKNLQGLSQLHNLKSFSFYDHTDISDSNKVKNLNEIGKLKNLNYLTFSSSNVENLDFLKGNNSITYLSLYMPNLTDISALKETNVEYLFLYECYNLADISPLLQVKSLLYLNNGNNDLKYSETNYATIKELSNCITVNFDFTRFEIAKTLDTNIKIAKDKLNATNRYNYHYSYTVESTNKLKLAIKEGEDVLNNKSYSKKQLEKANKNIDEAIQGLKMIIHK